MTSEYGPAQVVGSAALPDLNEPPKEKFGVNEYRRPQRMMLQGGTTQDMHFGLGATRKPAYMLSKISSSLVGLHYSHTVKFNTFPTYE